MKTLKDGLLFLACSKLSTEVLNDSYNKIVSIDMNFLPSSGTLRDLATSSKLKILVLTPLSLLSYFKIIFGILYLEGNEKNGMGTCR